VAASWGDLGGRLNRLSHMAVPTRAAGRVRRLKVPIIMLEKLSMEGVPSSLSPAAIETPPARQPYHRPELRVFGSVGRLTQAVGSANGDAGQGMML